METKDLNGIHGSLSDESNEEIFQVLWKEEQTDDQQIKVIRPSLRYALFLTTMLNFSQVVFTDGLIRQLGSRLTF